MQAVIVVKSPLQYVNALEACHHFDIALSESLLILMADKKSRFQLDRIASQENNWGAVIRLHDLPIFAIDKALHRPADSKGFVKYRFLNSIKFSKLASALEHVDYLLVGDIDNYLMRHLTHCLPSSQIVALDDGTKTLQSYRDRARGGEGSTSASRKMKIWLKEKFFGLQNRQIHAATFFTNYDLNPVGDDVIVKNDFDYLKQCIKKTEQTNKTYFIGGALVEANEFTEEEYLSQLALVADELNGEDVVYVAHRRESAERLIKIEKTFDWETVLFEFPIEYQIAVAGPVPNKMVSFTSTALLNCNLLFSHYMKIVSYKFSPRYFSTKNTEKGQRLERIYAYFEENKGDNFEIVDLA